MDFNTTILKGIQAEYEGRLADAASCYHQAWAEAADHYEACIAAHYVARTQESPNDIFHWNQEALILADKVHDERVSAFYPSLYVNLGRSYQLLGNQAEAERYYMLAAGLGLVHDPEYVQAK